MVASIVRYATPVHIPCSTVQSALSLHESGKETLISGCSGHVCCPRTYVKVHILLPFSLLQFLSFVSFCFHDFVRNDVITGASCTGAVMSTSFMGASQGSKYSFLEPTKSPLISHKATDSRSSIQGPSTFFSYGNSWRAVAWNKWLLIAAAVLPVPPSSLLLYYHLREKGFEGPLLAFTINSRATTQIFVSIIAGMLSALNIFVFTGLIKFSVRTSLVRSSVSLSKLRFLNAFTTQQVNFDQSGTASLLLIMGAALFIMPHIIWIGAVTPVVASQIALVERGTSVPAYTPESADNWSDNSRAFKGQCRDGFPDSETVFNACPTATLTSLLLTSASQASNSKSPDSGLARSKHDHSQYVFLGRSYGVGASVGLQSLSISTPLAYNYTEPGYLTEVTCFQNVTSDWHLELIKPGEAQYGIPYIYYATGRFPNGNWSVNSSADFFAVTGLGGDDEIAAIGARNGADRSIALLTAGETYIHLNQTQCDIIYTPSLFNVDVNTINRTIQVSPIPSSSGAASATVNFDPTHGLAKTATQQLNLVGLIETSLYVSQAGEALTTNIISHNTKMNSSTTSFSLSSNHTAISDSLISILDDLLLFTASSQFYLSAGNFSTPVPLTATFRVVKLGDPRYIYAVVATCWILALACAVSALSTNMWKLLPNFDFTDLQDLVLGAAIGGLRTRLSDRSEVEVDEQLHLYLHPCISTSTSTSSGRTSAQKTAKILALSPVTTTTTTAAAAAAAAADRISNPLPTSYTSYSHDYRSGSNSSSNRHNDHATAAAPSFFSVSTTSVPGDADIIPLVPTTRSGTTTHTRL